MSIIHELVSGGIEGLASGIGKLGRDLRAAITGKEALASNDIVKLAELADRAEILKTEAESVRIAAVNATMQAEAKSEHWMQWTWRPLFGFTACGMLVNNYILFPYMAQFGVVKIDVPAEVWLMCMAVLGVAAWTRGQANIEKAKNGGK